MKLEKGLLYTKEHEWIKVEGNKAYIGITDFAQHALGDIVFVDLPDADTEFNEGDSFAVVESVKAASDVYMPMSCVVVERNEEIVDDPSLLNQDAFKNWMVLVEITGETVLEGMLSAEEYEEFCAEEA